MTDHTPNQPESTTSARQDRYRVQMTITWERGDGEQRTTVVDRVVYARDIDEAHLVAALETDPPEDLRFRVHDIGDIAVDLQPITTISVEA